MDASLNKRISVSLWLQAFPLCSKLKRVKPQPGSLPMQWTHDRHSEPGQRSCTPYLPPRLNSKHHPPWPRKLTLTSLTLAISGRLTYCLSDSLEFDPMLIKFLLDKAPVNKLIPATSLL